jgi:hypothetical protein
MEGFGQVLQSVGETTQQSCLLLTSRDPLCQHTGRQIE